MRWSETCYDISGTLEQILRHPNWLEANCVDFGTRGVLLWRIDDDGKRLVKVMDKIRAKWGDYYEFDTFAVALRQLLNMSWHPVTIWGTSNWLAMDRDKLRDNWMELRQIAFDLWWIWSMSKELVTISEHPGRWLNDRAANRIIDFELSCIWTKCKGSGTNGRAFGSRRARNGRIGTIWKERTGLKQTLDAN